MTLLPDPKRPSWCRRQDLTPAMRELASRVHGFGGTGCYRRWVAEALVKRGVARWEETTGPFPLLLPADVDPYAVRNCNYRSRVHRTYWINPDTATATTLCGVRITSAVPTEADKLERCSRCWEKER